MTTRPAKHRTLTPLARLLRHRDAPRLRELAAAVEDGATVEVSGLAHDLQARLLQILALNARSADLANRQNAFTVLGAIS